MPAADTIDFVEEGQEAPEQIDFTPEESEAPIPPLSPQALALAQWRSQPNPGMESGTELTTAIASDPTGFLKSIPGDIGSALMAPGRVGFATAADIASKISANSPGGNIAAMEQGKAELPAEQAIAETAKTNPNLAVVANLGESLAEMGPMAALGSGPAGLNRLVAGGFSLQMIAGAREQKRQLEEELSKAPEDQDAGKIASLKSGLLQTFAFAPLAGAGAAHGLFKPKAPFQGPLATGEVLQGPKGAQPSLETQAAGAVSDQAADVDMAPPATLTTSDLQAAADAMRELRNRPKAAPVAPAAPEAVQTPPAPEAPAVAPVAAPAAIAKSLGGTAGETFGGKDHYEFPPEREGASRDQIVVPAGSSAEVVKQKLDAARARWREEAPQVATAKPEVATLAPGKEGAKLNKMGDPFGTTYRATPEDWAKWQELLKKPMMEAGVWPARETMKNKYGGMPPEAPKPAVTTAPPSPAPPAEDTIRLYHGSGGPEAAGQGGSNFSENPNRARSFGPDVTFVDVPKSVADAARQGVKTDYVLPDKWVRNAAPFKVEQTVHEIPEEPTPPSAAAPEKAGADSNVKAQAAVNRVVTTEGVTSGREAKSTWLDELNKAIEAAPSEDKFPGVKAERAKMDESIYFPDKSLWAKAKQEIGTVIIDIPGDGKTTILNTKEALQAVLDKAKSISTKANDPTKIKRRRTSPEDKEWIQEQLSKPGTTPEPKPAAPATGAGPGTPSAAQGADPTGSQLAQLSQQIRLQSISPKAPFAERLRGALDLAGKWGRGKDAATASVGKLVATKDALWQAYKNLPPWRDFEATIGRWIGADQRTAMEVREFQKALNKTVPNKLRREALTNWIQADGDEATLRSRMEASKPAVRRGYETALQLNDAEKTLARNISSYFESRLQEGIDAGILKQGVDAYVTQIWKRPTKATKKLWADLFGAGTLNPNFKFAKKRIFESYFEGEQKGYIPKNKDIGHLIATYDMSFNRALSARAMIRELHGGKAADGKPVVMTSGQGVSLPKGETPPEAILIKPNYTPKGAVSEDGRPYQSIDHWALRDWKWASKTGDTTVFVQGDMLVHPDHYDHLNNVLKTSRLRQGKLGIIGRPLLAAGAFAKQTKLSLSPFHTVQEGVHAMAHRVNPANPMRIDMSDLVQKSLVDHGLMVADPRGYELFTEGMGGGGLVGKIPGLGQLQQMYTEATFQDYIPRLKMNMAVDALERNRAAYAKDVSSGKVTDDQIVALTARESNAAFGEQNYRMMGRSPTTQDFLRIALLAPDFLEARARFVAQALKPYGREQRIALFLMGSTLYTAGRVLNKALDDDYHWNKPFSVFYHGKEYRLRTILGDVQHLMTDRQSFIYNRLSPISRTLSEYVTGRDDRGIKRSSMEEIADFLSWFKPIPLQIRPGESAGQAALASAGVPARTYSKQQELYETLDNWRSKQKDPKIKEAYDRQRQETHVQSPYGPLRLALNSGDTKSAKAEYQKLLTNRTPERIRASLNPNRPFTGSHATEQKFKASLSENQQKLYDEAKAERERMLKRFDDMRNPKAKEPEEIQFTRE